MDQKIAFFGRNFGKKLVFGGAGKDFGMKKIGCKKIVEKLRKIADFLPIFHKWPIFADFSARDLHVPGRRVQAAIFVDLSAINSKNRRFFGVFRCFFGLFHELSWPVDFFFVF